MISERSTPLFLTTTRQLQKIVLALIWETTQLLKEHPQIGRPGRVAGTRELVISDTPFIVPYRVISDEIQILRVIHGARNWPINFD